MSDSPVTSIAVSFDRSDTVTFLLDDDATLGWLHSFESGHPRVFVFIDANVERIWGAQVRTALAARGGTVFWHVVEPLESSKSLAYYPTALAFLEGHGAGRFDLVMGIGGGIVLDLVSFLVSTYMRGLPYYAVPTTLVGQMDATTAGKTCLNTAAAKNVLGTFYYPRVVYNNTRFLETNSPYFLRQGYAEIFKYGLLRSPELVRRLEHHQEAPTQASFRDLIRLSIEMRVSIAKDDPLASNLGHTFGHAIEKLSDFEILHGDAISAGTVMALGYAVRQGLMTDAVRQQVIARMRTLGLNVFFQRGIRAHDLVELMLRDKKSSSDALYLVLIRDIGVPFFENGSFFYRAHPRDVESFLEEYLTTSEFALDDCAGFLRSDRLYPVPAA